MHHLCREFPNFEDRGTDLADLLNQQGLVVTHLHFTEVDLGCIALKYHAFCEFSFFKPLRVEAHGKHTQHDGKGQNRFMEKRQKKGENRSERKSSENGIAGYLFPNVGGGLFPRDHVPTVISPLVQAGGVLDLCKFVGEYLGDRFELPQPVLALVGVLLDPRPKRE